MPLVSNTGPILSFAKANRLNILQEVVGELIIPRAVYEEIVVHGAGLPGAEAVQEGSWIRSENIHNPTLAEELADRLDPGEREALALAMELHLPPLVDESEARKEALRLGIPHFGSLKIIAEAKTRGIIPEGKPILDLLISAGMYITDPLYQSFIQLIGEA